MKVIVVTTIAYDYGIDEKLVGVFSSWERAESLQRASRTGQSLAPNNPALLLTEVELDKQLIEDFG